MVEKGNINNGEDKAPLLGSTTPKTFNGTPAFWNLVKSFAGAGSFALPWALSKSGLLTGAIGFVLIAAVSNYTMKLLIDCGIKSKEHPDYQDKDVSYADIGRVAFGRAGELIVMTLLFVVAMAVCIAYLILIGENFSALTGLTSRECIWIAVPIVTLLTCLTDLKYLGFTSVLGAVALMLAMGTVCYYGIHNHLARPLHDYPQLDIKQLPLWFGTAAFFFCDHIVIMPIGNASGDLYRFPTVLNIAMTFVTVVNTIFASTAYLLFNFAPPIAGNPDGGIAGNIIANLPGGMFVNIVRACICVELVFSFPLLHASGMQVMYSGSKLTERLFGAFPDTGSAYDERGRRRLISTNILFYVLRICINCVLALIASTISFFGLFVSLIGALVLAGSGFILPPAFYIKLHPDISTPRKILYGSIVFFGTITTGLGTYQAMQAIVQQLS